MKKKILIALALVGMCSAFMFSACNSDQSSNSESSSGNSSDISISGGAVSEDLESSNSSFTPGNSESSNSSIDLEDSESITSTSNSESDKNAGNWTGEVPLNN